MKLKKLALGLVLLLIFLFVAYLLAAFVYYKNVRDLKTRISFVPRFASDILNRKDFSVSRELIVKNDKKVDSLGQKLSYFTLSPIKLLAENKDSGGVMFNFGYKLQGKSHKFMISYNLPVTFGKEYLTSDKLLDKLTVGNEYLLYGYYLNPTLSVSNEFLKTYCENSEKLADMKLSSCEKEIAGFGGRRYDDTQFLDLFNEDNFVLDVKDLLVVGVSQIEYR